MTSRQPHPDQPVTATFIVTRQLTARRVRVHFATFRDAADRIPAFIHRHQYSHNVTWVLTEKA